jgi:hypothetical protein
VRRAVATAALEIVRTYTVTETRNATAGVMPHPGNREIPLSDKTSSRAGLSDVFATQQRVDSLVDVAARQTLGCAGHAVEAEAESLGHASTALVSDRRGERTA